jgi:hypothetical protein
MSPRTSLRCEVSFSAAGWGASASAARSAEVAGTGGDQSLTMPGVRDVRSHELFVLVWFCDQYARACVRTSWGLTPESASWPGIRATGASELQLSAPYPLACVAPEKVRRELDTGAFPEPPSSYKVARRESSRCIGAGTLSERRAAPSEPKRLAPFAGLPKFAGHVLAIPAQPLGTGDHTPSHPRGPLSRGYAAPLWWSAFQQPHLRRSFLVALGRDFARIFCMSFAVRIRW